ncbi:MAG: sugar phosphate isomerase/epimerase family protein [Bryobacteraceae bacterium]
MYDKTDSMYRREFLKSAAAFAAVPSMSGRLPISTAVEFSMLPESASIADRFQMARDAGFERIECPTTPDQQQAESMKNAAEKTGLKIHSVMNMDHWRYPLSSPDSAVVQKSLDGVKTSLHNAHLWGADTVLVVPAVVDANTSYRDAYSRSQKNIRTLIPLAEQLRVILAIEEVWNKFLLSPIEFAHYIDEFQSPWVRSYFDVGNVVLYGYPQDWIRTLGSRIVKLHIKDFYFREDRATEKRVAAWVSLGEGDIDWKAIYLALEQTGFHGTATVELPGGDASYLKEVCKRLNLILTGNMRSQRS